MTSAERALVVKNLDLVARAVARKPKVFTEDEAEAEAMFALCLAVMEWKGAGEPHRSWIISRIRFRVVDAARYSGLIRHRIMPKERNPVAKKACIVPISTTLKSWRKDNFAGRHAECESENVPTDLVETDSTFFKLSEWRRDGELAVAKLDLDVAIDALEPKEAEVIRLTLKGESLDTVGEAIGLSGNRACQVRAKALGKLRESLEDYR